MSIAFDDFALSGDADAIRMSAAAWAQCGTTLATAAAEVSTGVIDDFMGDESIIHAERVVELAHDLEQSAGAWYVAARALAEYADVLQICQHRLAVLGADAVATVNNRFDAWARLEMPNAPPIGWRDEDRPARVRVEHRQAVVECVSLLARATSLLPRRSRTVGTLSPPSQFASAPRPIERPGLPDLASRLRSAAVTSAVAFTLDDGAVDFWSDIADLLGWATLGVTAMGAGGAGGVAAVGGEVIAGGAAASVAGPLVAGAAVAVVLLGGALLVTAAIKGESPGETWDDLTTDEVAGSPQVDPNGLHQIAATNRANLPPDVVAEVDKAVARAKAGRTRSPGHDGEPWGNALGQLPARPRDYYREWDAAAPGKRRGAHRVIIAGDPAHPDAIYYWDHTGAAPVYIGP